MGDCYLIAALGAIADASPAAIENMIIDNGVENGIQSWTVRFYYQDAAGAYVPDYVTVNALLPADANGNVVYAQPGPDGSWWLPILEKAYAQWNESGREGRDGQNSYASLYCGWMQDVDAQVLGTAATTYWLTSPPAQQTVIAELEGGAAVTAATDFNSNAALMSQLGLVADHAYVVGYDADPASPDFGEFQLENPWGWHEPAALTWNELCGVLRVPSGGRGSIRRPRANIVGSRREFAGRRPFGLGDPRGRPLVGCFAAVRAGCGGAGRDRGS